MWRCRILEKVKVGKVVYLNDLDEEKFKDFSKQVGVSIDKKEKNHWCYSRRRRNTY